MIYTIHNDKLKVGINSRGGELWSIQDTCETQYLWQGDKRYWGDRAFHIFPYIARLTEGKYSYANQEYEMGIHGFLKDTELLADQESEAKIVFRMESSQETLKQYPFTFTFEVQYELVNSSLEITYRVFNKDHKTMYFGVGGHPGFNVPLEEGVDFADYYLEFSQLKNAIRVGMSEDCFVTKEDENYLLKGGTVLPLHHSLFDRDAILFKNMDTEITLKSAKSDKKITVAYPQMNYLGIWHMPHTDAPYVCIEPWSSLPSRKGIVEKLEEQENLIALEAKQTYSNKWTITI